MRRARIATAAVAVLVASLLTGMAISTALSGEDAERDVPGRLSALPGGARGGTDFSAQATQGVPAGSSIVARARRRSVRVFRRPHGHDARTIYARRFNGRRLPLVFLVRARRPGWVHAYLPTRPNLSTAWLRERDVRLALTRFRLKVQLDRHRLTLLERGKAVMRARIAKGRAVSPTPTGRYYLTDLIRPPDPNGFYGPYAFGLSAHSRVYTSFAGGDGQVGLHGTNRPSVLGSSHGCLRVSNRVITRLAKRLPLGTPIDISRR